MVMAPPARTTIAVSSRMSARFAERTPRQAFSAAAGSDQLMSVLFSWLRGYAASRASYNGLTVSGCAVLGESAPQPGGVGVLGDAEDEREVGEAGVRVLDARLQDVAV